MEVAAPRRRKSISYEGEDALEEVPLSPSGERSLYTPETIEQLSFVGLAYTMISVLELMILVADIYFVSQVDRAGRDSLPVVLSMVSSWPAQHLPYHLSVEGRFFLPFHFMMLVGRIYLVLLHLSKAFSTFGCVSREKTKEPMTNREGDFINLDLHYTVLIGHGIIQSLLCIPSHLALGLGYVEMIIPSFVLIVMGSVLMAIALQMSNDLVTGHRETERRGFSFIILLLGTLAFVAPWIVVLSVYPTLKLIPRDPEQPFWGNPCIAFAFHCIFILPSYLRYARVISPTMVDILHLMHSIVSTMTLYGVLYGELSAYILGRG